MINFIVNILSGKGAARKALHACQELAVKNGESYATYVTQGEKHAKEIAETLSRNGESLIIGIGGDGTFHEILNGIDPNITAVGFVPAGSGNDFAKAMNLSKNPETAMNQILAGKKRQIDYIQVGDVRCLNVAGTGMDVDVLKAVYNKSNKLTYYASLVNCLIHFKPYECTVITGGKTLKSDCIMIGVANGQYFGGGIRLSPNSLVDDHLLQLVIIEKKDRGLLKILPKFVKGRHSELPEISVYDVEEVEIINHGLSDHALRTDALPSIELDGEIYNNIPFKCKIVKNGLTTF